MEVMTLITAPISALDRPSLDTWRWPPVPFDGVRSHLGGFLGVRGDVLNGRRHLAGPVRELCRF